LTKLQVAQYDLIQKRRQARIAQPDFAIERVIGSGKLTRPAP
jgi:hypothetical protein